MLVDLVRLWLTKLAAVDDHLLCDLHEEDAHLGRSGVVPRDGVHHSNVIEQAGQRVDNLQGRSGVQRLNVLRNARDTASSVEVNSVPLRPG